MAESGSRRCVEVESQQLLGGDAGAGAPLPTARCAKFVVALATAAVAGAAAVGWAAGKAPIEANNKALVAAYDFAPAGDGTYGFARLVESSKDGPAWEEKEQVPIRRDFPYPIDGVVVDIDASSVFQAIQGFGGAFTESSSTLFQKLNAENQEQFLNEYFGPDGLEYTLGRVHINSCDFSIDHYSYDDVPGDLNLDNFDSSAKHDEDNGLIGLMQRAQAKVKERGQELKMLASPWSPPAWMKTNGQMGLSGSPGLRPDFRDVWARYLAKWVSAFKAKGLPMWAMTVQNEPEANSSFEACLFTPEYEADFLGDFLGPTMRAAHPDVKIFVFDHNKDRAFDYSRVALDHATASQYISGVAFHWYAGDHFDQVERLRQQYPSAMLLPSEATYEKWRWDPSTSYNWAFGEGYAHDIIGDLNAGGVGWIDWNLLLDMGGGPNHVGNLCDAAMMADVGQQKLWKHPQYFFIGHFSKYLPPTSRRLVTIVTGSVKYVGDPRPYGQCSGKDGLQATAFLRPDQRIAVVVLNCGDIAIDYKLRNGACAMEGHMPAHGIQTWILEDMPQCLLAPPPSSYLQ